jgi:hypothetical protein
MGLETYHAKRGGLFKPVLKSKQCLSKAMEKVDNRLKQSKPKLVVIEYGAFEHRIG